MLRRDAFTIEILEDGRIVIDTADGRISAVNHMQAEQLLRNVHDLCGGSVTVERRAVASTGIRLVQTKRVGQ